MTGGRTTYLLGAGASVEAGLPTSTGLTQKVTAAVDDAVRWNNTAQALHVAIGAMIAHDTGRGGPAFAGIDVERLFAAIRMLADRDSLDIAPFVEAWNRNLENFGTERLPSFFGKQFRTAVFNDPFGDVNTEKKFTEGVRALAGRRDLGPTFRRLQSQMIQALGTILTVNEADVDYLRPLLIETEHPLQIATLNYDHSVELMCRREGKVVDTGITEWSGGYQWSWKQDNDVRLLKLHGSLDWYLSRDLVQGGLSTDRVYLGSDLEPDARERMADQLALVFGQGSKLRSDGPFLAMLVEFDQFLASTDHLIIVGYSFRDDHINAAIRRWFNGIEKPRVSIVNPSVTEWDSDYHSAPEFYRELSHAMRDHTAMTYPEPLLEGHALIADGAGAGLQRLAIDRDRARGGGAAP